MGPELLNSCGSDCPGCSAPGGLAPDCVVLKAQGSPLAQPNPNCRSSLSSTALNSVWVATAHWRMLTVSLGTALRPGLCTLPMAPMIVAASASKRNFRQSVCSQRSGVSAQAWRDSSPLFGRVTFSDWGVCGRPVVDVPDVCTSRSCERNFV